jgi:hypothetical protein
MKCSNLLQLGRSVKIAVTIWMASPSKIMSKKKKKKKPGPSPHVPLEEAVPTQPDKSFVVFAHHPVHPCLHFGIPPKNWWLL